MGSMQRFDGCNQGSVDIRSFTQDSELFGRLVTNDAQGSEARPYVFSLLGREFIMPPHSRFLMSDISQMEPLLLGTLLCFIDHYDAVHSPSTSSLLPFLNLLILR